MLWKDRKLTIKRAIDVNIGDKSLHFYWKGKPVEVVGKSICGDIVQLKAKDAHGIEYIANHSRDELCHVYVTVVEDLPILKEFEYAHLSRKLQVISMPFHDLAYDVATRRVSDILVQHQVTQESYNLEEINTCLHRLLEAKEAAIRAASG